MRLIDADELWDDLVQLGFTYFARADISRAIKEAPTIEAEPVKRGKWIEKRGHRSFISGGDIEDYTYYICSECAREEITKEPYCHCGARMVILNEID